MRIDLNVPMSPPTALRFIHRLACDQSGATAIYVGLGMMVFVGSAGLAVDIASWYRAKRMMQTAVDAAAYAGALDLARQGLSVVADEMSMQAAANDAAMRNGMTLPVTVHHPPTSGLEINDDQSVEVIVSEPAPMLFTSAFFGIAPQVSARAVAKAVVADACVYALNPTEAGALTISGTSSVVLGCGVVVNSTHEQAALDQNGTSCLSATAVTVAGGYDGNCVTPDPEVYTPQYGDPLSHLQEPTVGPRDHNNVHISGGGSKDFDGNNNGVDEFDPGVYCGGIQISGGTSVFSPGLYILDGGEFRVSGSATVSNTENAAGGVTFFLTGSGANYATLWIASGANVTLTPPDSGPYKDILFFQDPDAPQGNSIKFTGGSTMDLEGALYFPSAAINFVGGSAADEAEVLVVGDTVNFSGNSYLSADYAGSILNDNAYARLVE